jgi:hypothetical protein
MPLLGVGLAALAAANKTISVIFLYILGIVGSLYSDIKYLFWPECASDPSSPNFNRFSFSTRCIIEVRRPDTSRHLIYLTPNEISEAASF